MGNIVSYMNAFCKTYYFTFTFMEILPFWFDKKSDILQNMMLFYKVKVSYSFHTEGISVYLLTCPLEFFDCCITLKCELSKA